jgi:hypothetical protein
VPQVKVPWVLQRRFLFKASILYISALVRLQSNTFRTWDLLLSLHVVHNGNATREWPIKGILRLDFSPCSWRFQRLWDPSSGCPAQWPCLTPHRMTSQNREGGHFHSHLAVKATQVLLRLLCMQLLLHCRRANTTVGKDLPKQLGQEIADTDCCRLALVH